MDEAGSDEGSLVQRIKQLERERDDLQKDIEQLCMQQAGPSYLAVATRIHFQRTAGLEKEIENLRKKLAACVRNNQNLQEELSEAYRIKSQLADLHSAEVSKNMEAEKQIKFFQGCVASAFAERDNSIIEAEKAKEQEDTLSEKLCVYENRYLWPRDTIDEPFSFNLHKSIGEGVTSDDAMVSVVRRLQDLQSAYVDEKKNNTFLQMELKKLKEQNESFEKVICKFYEVRERATGLSECKSLEGKCSFLLDDPEEMWIFDCDGKRAPSSYINSLQEQIVTLRESVENLQQKMRMGMEIEQHLRKKVRHLEKKLISAGNLFGHCLSTLRELHSQQRSTIVNILEAENSEIKSVLVEVQEKMRLNYGLNSCASLREEDCEITDHRQEDITSDADFNATDKEEDPAALSIAVDSEPNTSDVLAQALKEKVEALLLLSQQEERHLLEGDLNHRKMEDLQRNLVQVTTEKVKALVELAQLKKDYQLLQEKGRHGVEHVKFLADDDDKSIVAQERSAKLKNLLKKSYLRRWVGRGSESENDIHTAVDGNSPTKKSGNYSMDLARLKVENATLQESATNIGHLASSIHKLRLSLLKVINDSRSAASAERVTTALDDIFHEVDRVKMALSSSIPVSWSSAAELTPCEQNSDNQGLHLEASGNAKLDPITAAGLEMVELLIVAAELARDNMITGTPSSFG